MEFLVAPVVAALTTVLGSIVSYILQKYFIKKPDATPYAERLSAQMKALNDASQKVDELLTELTTVAHDRESAVRKIEADLAELQKKEQETQRRIETLKNVPIEAVAEFAALTEPGEKRSARRDYILFGAGVIVSTVISIVLQILLT